MCAGHADKLVLDGINPADVSLICNGGDVVLGIPESKPGAGDGGPVVSIRQKMSGSQNCTPMSTVLMSSYCPALCFRKSGMDLP
ncbi:hypothetical protein [Ochrobactrum sp. Marseille-Q0166]|uniref:hypothetical protein n=1 Tax=Ochrobactrum sp. Marseille-Q0166 TaxID=2761105 RepID=UPI0016553609|nr:hypothetical protein [Ochrobactrum sp. Marseille-Q0166]MBC8719894.1 hypothetical protein [Ochrobactrum sp. Marseille-Q0166]